MADLILPDPRLEMPELFIPGQKPYGRTDVTRKFERRHLVALWSFFPVNKYAEKVTNTRIGVGSNWTVNPRGLLLDGTGAPKINMSISPPQFTVMARIRMPIAQSGSMAIIDTDGWTYTNNYSGFQLCVQSTNNVFLQVGDGAGTAAEDRRAVASNTGSLPVGKSVWVTGAFTNTNSMQIYFDHDQQSASYSGSGTSIGYTSTLNGHLGSRASGSYFNGLIEDVRVFDVPLSQDEISRQIRDPYSFLDPS